MLTGTLVNTGAVIVGACIGLLLGNIFPERFRDIIIKALSLCVIYIGITGLLGETNILITFVSMVIGATIGELIDLDTRLNRVAARLENKFKNSTGGPTIAEGLVTSAMVFCVGAMSIVGALNDGLTGNHEILFTKSVLDFLHAIIFASTMGLGVLFSAVPVFLFQGSIACLAGLLAPLLQQNNTIQEMVVVGSILIIGLGFNLLGICKLKIANYLPAVFMPIPLCLFM